MNDADHMREAINTSCPRIDAAVRSLRRRFSRTAHELAEIEDAVKDLLVAAADTVLLTPGSLEQVAAGVPSADGSPEVIRIADGADVVTLRLPPEPPQT